MNRPLAVTVVALAVLAACEDKSKTPAAPAVEPSAALEKKAMRVEPAKVAEPVAEKEPEQIVVTDALLDKYLVVQKDVVAAVKQHIEATRADLAKMKAKDSAAEAMAALARAGEREKKVQETTDAAIAKAGLTREQYDRVHEAANDVAVERLLFEQAGGEAGVAKMEADLKAELKVALEKMPPAEREKAEKEALEATRGLRELGNAKDARKKYGDPSVDTVLKRLADVKAMRDELVALMK